jgi:hypothetical protein
MGRGKSRTEMVAMIRLDSSRDEQAGIQAISALTWSRITGEKRVLCSGEEPNTQP